MPDNYIDKSLIILCTQLLFLNLQMAQKNKEQIKYLLFLFLKCSIGLELVSSAAITKQQCEEAETQIDVDNIVTGVFLRYTKKSIGDLAHQCPSNCYI